MERNTDTHGTAPNGPATPTAMGDAAQLAGTASAETGGFELELHLIPVLFGQGRRLFEGLAPEQIELERTRILEGENGVTHLHYRVRR
jgi:hypothetical protein